MNRIKCPHCNHEYTDDDIIETLEHILKTESEMKVKDHAVLVHDLEALIQKLRNNNPIGENNASRNRTKSEKN